MKRQFRIFLGAPRLFIILNICYHLVLGQYIVLGLIIDLIAELGSSWSSTNTLRWKEQVVFLILFGPLHGEQLFLHLHPFSK